MTTAKNPGITAAIMNDPEYDSVAMVERRQWRVALSAGADRRRLTTSRREAIEWCQEMGVPYVLAPAPRPRNEYIPGARFGDPVR